MILQAVNGNTFVVRNIAAPQSIVRMSSLPFTRPRIAAWQTSLIGTRRYVGVALNRGVSPSDAAWRIRAIDVSAKKVWYAAGDTFSQVWDNHEQLLYS